MKADPDDLKVNDVLELKSQQMLVVNPEYQRGIVWTAAQKKASGGFRFERLSNPVDLSSSHSPTSRESR